MAVLPTNNIVSDSLKSVYFDMKSLFLYELYWIMTNSDNASHPILVTQPSCIIKSSVSPFP